MASSTEIIAVPMEDDTCWMMFSIVLARGTSSWTSVWIAAAMVGIIVMPMPRPITNSAPPSAQ